MNVIFYRYFDILQMHFIDRTWKCSKSNSSAEDPLDYDTFKSPFNKSDWINSEKNKPLSVNGDF